MLLIADVDDYALDYPWQPALVDDDHIHMVYLPVYFATQTDCERFIDTSLIPNPSLLKPYLPRERRRREVRT